MSSKSSTLAAKKARARSAGNMRPKARRETEPTLRGDPEGYAGLLRNRWTARKVRDARAEEGRLTRQAEARLEAPARRRRISSKATIRRMLRRADRDERRALLGRFSPRCVDYAIRLIVAAEKGQR